MHAVPDFMVCRHVIYFEVVWQASPLLGYAVHVGMDPAEIR